MPRTPTYDRNDLITRAQEIFWRRGWAGTSMKDLENGLNLRPGSFYAAFGSKDALYQLALDQYAKNGLARLERMQERIGAFKALKQYPCEIVSGKEIPIRACMLSKTLLELQDKENPLAERATQHLSAMEAKITTLFKEAQNADHISTTHNPANLARRYQSDLMGLRISAERPDVDAIALAEEISIGVARL